MIKESNRLEEIYYEKNKFVKGRKTLVFLHGLTGNTKRWDCYYSLWENKYNLILIDLIGHGESEKSKELNKYSENFISKKIFDILNEEEIDEATFVCHSISFRIALKLWRLEPKRINSLIFITPFFYKEYKKNLLRSKRIINLLKKIWRFIPQNSKKKNFFANKNDEKINFFDHLNSIKSIGAKSYIATVYYSFNFEEFDILKSITCPVLVIYGENDKLTIQTDIIFLKRNIKNIKFKRLDVNGHCFLNDKMKEIIKEIELFL